MRYGFSPEELLAEDAAPLPDFIMMGASVDFKMEAWNGLHRVLIAIGK